MSMREMAGRLSDGKWTTRGRARSLSLPERFARPALLGAVALAAALSLVWVFLVPIYQAPDEPNHLDYAFSILAAGHLISAADGPTSQYVHPYTRALLGTTQTGAIAFHSSVPAPRHYGTLSYYGSLMRLVSSDLRGYRQREPAHTPLLITVYPFGYYALVAAWMGIVQIVWANPVQLFFAARTLSVLLLIGSLCLIYASLRRLRLDATRSVAVVAALGIFPLTSFVSSYVQPDNLALFLVSAAVYIGLRLRDATSVAQRYGFAGLLGVALGALLVTKYQFYICVGVPLGAMLLTYRRWRAVPRAHVGMPVLLFLPSLVFLAIQLWVSHGADLRLTHAPGFPHMTYADASAALAGGPGTFAAYAWGALQRALQDYYWGSTFHSFWGDFGWLDTPLVIGSPSIEQWLLLAIQDGTLLLLTLTLVRLIQVGIRVLKLARHRPRVALRLAAGNPLVSAYFLFTLFMYALYIASDDSFGAQGRDWFPLLAGSFLVGTIFAPAALGRRAGSIVSGCILGALLAYGAVGSVYALQDIHARYYGPQPAAGWTRGQAPLRLPKLGPAVDHIDSVFVGQDVVEASGWAVDAAAGGPARAVYVSVDSHRDYRAVYGSYRPDVAEVLGNNRFQATGFWVEISTTTLKPGEHSLVLKVVSASGRGYFLSRPPWFFVTHR